MPRKTSLKHDILTQIIFFSVYNECKLQFDTTMLRNLQGILGLVVDDVKIAATTLTTHFGTAISLKIKMIHTMFQVVRLLAFEITLVFQGYNNK